MTANQPARTDAAAAPAQNMRITFWGVQGSTPIFPTPYGVQEYSRRLAVYVLGRAVEQMQHLAKSSKDGRFSIRDLIGGEPTRANIEAYQERVGLPELPFYGGETTCVEIETDEGNVIILDAGTGIRRCSLEIVKRWETRKERVLHIFGSHEHLDHRSGLTFSRFCYTEPNPYTINVYGSYQFLHALDQHYGLFSRRISDTTYVDDPVDYTTMPATFKGLEFTRPGDTTPRKHRYWDSHDMTQPIRIGKTTITPFEVYHVIPVCLGYKIEHNGRTFVFATDHERRRGPDPNDPRQQRSEAAEARLDQYCKEADLAYLDGQYLLEEYLGNKGIGTLTAIPRLDWGHSCVEDVVERAKRCNIRRTLIGHHDPERAWPERAELDQKLAKQCEGQAYQIQMADNDQVIDL